MAWTSQGEEVLETLTQYVVQLSPLTKAKLGHTYDKAINRFSGEWTNLNGITFVNLQNREIVWDNLSLAMLKEAIGLGPQCYYIVQSYNVDFENLLMLTLHYLCKIKFCMYPEDQTLGGPFLYTPWDILGRESMLDLPYLLIVTLPILPIEQEQPYLYNSLLV